MHCILGLLASKYASSVTDKTWSHVYIFAKKGKWILWHVSRSTLSNMVAINYIWVFTFYFIKIKYNIKISLSLVLATFPVLNSLMWLVATILNSSDIHHFHHYTKLYWTALNNSTPSNASISPIIHCVILRQNKSIYFCCLW